MQLVKDFTAEHAHDEVKFYMGMVVDEQQTFKGLVQHLKNAFQSSETTSELISNFYARAQKKNESEEAFADELQILVCKIIARKPEFREDANEQLKSQYAHKLKDPYYAAIAQKHAPILRRFRELYPVLGASGNDIWWQEQVGQDQLPYSCN